MRVGVAAETKVAEGRVALTPAGTRELTARGHEVLVESDAGARSGFPDSSYRVAGAPVLTNSTMPYVLRLADRGVEAALETSADLAAGLNVIDGAVVHPAIASNLEVVRG